MGQERLGASYFFISLVLGPLNSLLEESTDPNRYTAKAKFCFCKNNKRMIIIMSWGRRVEDMCYERLRAEASVN